MEKGRGSKVPSSHFYRTYHGHEVPFLERVLKTLRESRPGVIFLAGDSSLDNKYWFHTQKPALNGYEDVLEPPVMKTDVCYWLNHELMQRRGLFNQGPALCAVNTAVEATTLGQRVGGWFSSDCLLPQDEVIRDNIGEQDILVISVGGNDIALAPTLSTILSMLMLVYTASDQAINAGNAWGLGHFISLFGRQLQQYVELLVGRQKPRKVLVCMIYFPDVAGEGSWADTALSSLQYNSNPGRLQAAIRAVFEHAVSHIHIEGTEVVPVPLFQTLDGTDTHDYVARVEPSVQGGQKMAKALLDKILAP